jgi:GMP synthase (glutamine-hydrolysing)
VTAGRLLIVKTGSTVPSVRQRRGDFEDWIAAGLGVPLSSLDVAAVNEGAVLPEPGGLLGVVITGSAAFVSEREAWSVAAEQWIVPLVRAGLPVLGICYGHQLIAQALGGRVGRNPNGREIGTVPVDLSLAVGSRDPLLGALPATAPVHVTHLESVLRLPQGATLLGSTAADPHHAFRVGRRTWGVQFHPEFDADILRGYVSERAGELRAEGIDPEAVAAGIEDTPHGAAVLKRFLSIARGEV